MVALLLAVCLSACGGSGTARPAAASQTKVSASAYVTSLCQAVGPFEAAVAARSKTLDDAGSMSAATGKTRLVGFLSSLSRDSATAVDRLRAAGVPEVAGGAGFAATILTTFTRLSGTLSRSEKVAQTLSTSSQPAFRVGATNLATAVKDSVGEIGAGLSSQTNKPLDAAAAKVSACHEL